MRWVKKPSYRADLVLKMCIDNIKDTTLNQKLTATIPLLNLASADYDLRGTATTLFEISAFLGKKEDIVTGGVTKKELTSLYSTYFVPADLQTRQVYDALINLAPNRICLLCGFGNVYTLDHYLPKAKFPLYSVVPQNLIPACRDCNMGKLASYSTKVDQQSIHPYYDKDIYFTEQWLFATVLETNPVSLSFHASPPEGWLYPDPDRVIAHFQEFHFSSRLSVQAATELSAISEHLVSVLSVADRKFYLEDKFKVYSSLHKNSWQTAMTQALAKSEWYYTEGYRLSFSTGIKKHNANLRYCFKCERIGKNNDSFYWLCDFHGDPDIDEHDIPPYTGQIPDGSVCEFHECLSTPVKILKGKCVCEYHFYELAHE